ncbi:MAG TPA: transporter substrate-binding domain-containing protein [Deltaproteobacteria bacterium]|nr:transporter substrate-binding domain-containing protein [Deltaproteobacteria bacterium]HQI82110.1 transporter substrate-binding domain-containing protein [Deltaproteobacteria bacterium]
MRHVIPAVLFLTVFALSFAHADALTVSYLHRPPYYYTDKDGNPSGFLVELTRDILRDAGIEVVWKELPPNRIMLEIRKRGALHCSIGWFRTQEREAYAKFSIPIYQDKPLVIMTTTENARLFSSHTVLSEVFSDTSLVLATVSSFSYGDYVDRLLRTHCPRMHVVSTDRSVLTRLIKMRRASYLLTAPEEVDTLIASAGLARDDFILIPMKDLPSGMMRHLMFSLDVGDDILAKVNASIRKITENMPRKEPATGLKVLQPGP